MHTLANRPMVIIADCMAASMVSTCARGWRQSCGCTAVVALTDTNALAFVLRRGGVGMDGLSDTGLVLAAGSPAEILEGSDVVSESEAASPSDEHVVDAASGEDGRFGIDASPQSLLADTLNAGGTDRCLRCVRGTTAVTLMKVFFS